MSAPGEIKIERYNSSFTRQWNEFVDDSKNSTFLFNRSYVDYHSDRFKDHSLMIFLRGKLSALFIANESEGKIYSHQGLTYGGLILVKESRLEEVLQFFYHAVKYYHSQKFSTIIYKCFPAYLSEYPSNEDLYAMHLLDASLIRRETSMVLDQVNRLPSQQRRKKSHKTFKSGQFSIVKVDKADSFWDNVLIPNLKSRFDAAPVHSKEEINLLLQKFPDHILQYEIGSESILAGAVVFVFRNAVHLQYLSTTEEGRELEAMDVLVHYLIEEFASKKYFSFGTSNGTSGKGLNIGLANWKEGFGASTWVHDFYEFSTEAHTRLKEYE